MQPQLLPFELLTVRAADVDETGDVMETPDHVWVWDENQSRWVSKFVQNVHQLAYPRWHLVYEAFGQLLSPDKGEYGFKQYQELNENYIMFRVGTEQPNNGEMDDLLIALHQYELVRVQRIQRPTTASETPEIEEVHA